MNVLIGFQVFSSSDHANFPSPHCKKKKIILTLNRACKVSKTSLTSAAGQAGSESSEAMIDFNSSSDSCGLCIHINALTTIPRTYTHSHATVVRTTSINEASKLAIVSLRPGPAEIDDVLRIPAIVQQLK